MTEGDGVYGGENGVCIECINLVYVRYMKKKDTDEYFSTKCRSKELKKNFNTCPPVRRIRC